MDGFLIENNEIWNVDNISIDVIGGEGTSDSQDIARNGIVRNNYVHGTTGKDAWAAACYVDGGANISILDNVLDGNDLARIRKYKRVVD